MLTVRARRKDNHEACIVRNSIYAIRFYIIFYFLFPFLIFFLQPSILTSRFLNKRCCNFCRTFSAIIAKNEKYIRAEGLVINVKTFKKVLIFKK